MAVIKMRKRSRKDLKSRILNLISPEPNTGCWLWTAATHSTGLAYAVITISDGNGGRKQEYAHRESYKLFKGPLNGMSVLHKCDTPQCVNPDHLFLGTLSDNTKDMVRKKRQVNSRKTHCSYGHEFNLENTYITSTGRRRCRACNRIKALETYYLKKSTLCQPCLEFPQAQNP